MYIIHAYERDTRALSRQLVGALKHIKEIMQARDAHVSRRRNVHTHTVFTVYMKCVHAVYVTLEHSVRVLIRPGIHTMPNVRYDLSVYVTLTHSVQNYKSRRCASYSCLRVFPNSEWN